MSSLVSLAELANEIHETLLSSVGELTPELEAKLKDLESKLPNKADGYAYVCEDLEHKADMLTSMANKYYNAAKALSNHATGMKSLMKQALQLVEGHEIRGNEHKWKLVNAKAKVVIDDESKVPDQYCETTIVRTPRKDILYADLICHHEIPGCHLEKSNYAKASINTK